VAVGYLALSADDVGQHNVAIGRQALENLNIATASNTYNTAVGSTAGAAVTTGIRNTIVGGLAADALTEGGRNVSLGYAALSADTKGSRSVAIGYEALGTQNFTTATDNYNVGIGYLAGNVISTGLRNTLVGGLAGDVLTDADENTAMGYGALSSDTLGSKSTALGRSALGQQNFTTATNTLNTAVGYFAGLEVTTGVQNTIVGAEAADAMTSGSSNTFMGYQTGGSGVITGGANNGFGTSALLQLTSGDNNIGVGNAAGMDITSGDGNICIGHDSGRPASPSGSISTGDNQICLGNNNITTISQRVSTTVTSDQRDKTDVVDLSIGLDFVKALEPVVYKWDQRSDYLDPEDDSVTIDNVTPDGTHKKPQLDVGFLAQKVVEQEEALGHKISDETNLVSSLSVDGTRYGLKYEKFVPILVKAIQELSAEVEKLKSGG
jgi:hypothetical protein